MSTEAASAAQSDGDWLVINALRNSIVHVRGCKCSAQLGDHAREMLETELDAALIYAIEKLVSQ